jgi:two-component system, LytTR family, response regulator
MMLSALIVDDEPLARKQLRDLIRGVPWLECIGEASDGARAVELVDRDAPDIVFLDIQMPGMLGIEVLRRVRRRPAVIFTTAYDRYAVTAFELQAMDYLLKPFGRERFEAALARARSAILDRSAWPGDRIDPVAGPRPMTRLFVRERGRIVPVPLASIERFEARDDYVALHADGRRHLVHMSMNDLEAMMDPERFVRIHRRHIVNLDHVAGFTPHDGTRLEVELRSGTRLVASRARSRTLRGLVP